MSDELKPCPFCGGEAAMGSGMLSSNGDKYYFVNCVDCLASTNIFIPESAAYMKDMAIEAWNTRTESNETE